MGTGSAPGGRATTGKGGIDRGPGHVPLQFSGDSQGGAEQAMPLPQGAPLPHDWVPLGARAALPLVDPQRDGGEGREGEAGRGGASWQLRIAPRHRAVLQRFFGSEGPR